jgi:hypothetical protein
VVLVCDRAYVEKADQRSGGVGTEAQIISGELYAKGEQDKFVAVVRERHESGEACLPAYYASRIYIDLSDATSYSDNFDRLVRWAFDKPLYQKPEVGEPPSFLERGEGAASLATASRFRRAIDAIRSNRDYADGAASDYLQCFAQELELGSILPRSKQDGANVCFGSVGPIHRPKGSPRASRLDQPWGQVHHHVPSKRIST